MAKQHANTGNKNPYAVDEALAEAQRLAREREIDDFKFVMGDPRGRRVVWRILEKAGIYRSSYTGNSETFFREGERNIGLMLLAEMMATCPELHIAMLQEKDNDD